MYVSWDSPNLQVLIGKPLAGSSLNMIIIHCWLNVTMISLKWVGALIRYLQSVFQIISVICNVANSCESSCFLLMILYNIDMMWWLWVLFPRKLRDGSEIKLLKTIVLEESRGFHRMAMSSNVVMIWWMVTKGSCNCCHNTSKRFKIS